MLSGIAFKVVLVFGLLSSIAGGWFYVQSLRAELDAASLRTERAMDVVNEQVITMEKLQKDIKLIQTISNDLNEKMQKAETRVTTLNNKFDADIDGRARDIGKEAKIDPKKWAKKINRATKDALRCNELVTGAIPLADETNSQCPELVPGVYTKSSSSTSLLKEEMLDDLHKTVIRSSIK
jgi:hypothetical protein|tara:strand:- start:872 stop:1411 length:540 start_codon:yes stop_codon:yes gene_type:complete